MADLDLKDKIKLQTKFWAAARTGWILIVLFLVAVSAVLGESFEQTKNLETVGRSIAIFFILFILLRVSGRRTLGETTTFDFVLLLILSEACQEALVQNDSTILTASIVLATLVICDILLSLIKLRWPRAEEFLDGVPTIIMADGKLLAARMKKARIDQEDILESARKSHGIGSLKQISHAILEKNGEISIVPAKV